MKKKDFQFFKELVEAPSPSGFEQPAQRVIRKALSEVADEIRTDVMGNVVAHVRGPEGAPRLMLAGHCDEIGFMVKYVDERGYLFFAPIGGVDAHLVPGQRVTVHAAGGPVAGVVGKRPIHQIEAKNREKVLPFKDQFIDIGCGSRDEAAELVSVGDPVTFSVGVERLQGSRLTSRALDDKMGAFIVAQVLREVRRQGAQNVDLYGVSTVQEEVGLRGGTTSAYGIQPDIGIAVEVGFASDYPGADQPRQGADYRPGPEHQPGPVRSVDGDRQGGRYPLPGDGHPACHRHRRQCHAAGAWWRGDGTDQYPVALHAYPGRSPGLDGSRGRGPAADSALPAGSGKAGVYSELRHLAGGQESRTEQEKTLDNTRPFE